MTEEPGRDEVDFPDEEAEDDLYDLNMTAEQLGILLSDKATGGNILWATDEYAARGCAFAAGSEMRLESVIGCDAVAILPRVTKNWEGGCTGAPAAAEVFSPAWLCNGMANFWDDAWFGRRGVFNTAAPDHTWQATPGEIRFPSGKTWLDYVGLTCLEIACGEAPCLVSRYDAASGDFIPLEKRIGLLDRKLRVVGERTGTEAEWFRHALRAFQSVYGYEKQGDNLLLARQNLLWTFDDYYWERWHDVAGEAQRSQIADVISWNLWQMDGLPDSVSYARCKIRLWHRNETVRPDQLAEDGRMWFDVVIGDPQGAYPQAAGLFGFTARNRCSR